MKMNPYKLVQSELDQDTGQIGDQYTAIDTSPSEEESIEPDPAKGGSRFNGHWVKTQDGWKFIKDKVWFE